MSERVHVLPKTVISSTQILTRRSRKRLGIGILPLGRLKMVISTYSNILLSVSMINMTKSVYVGGRERPLRLFEVLARNRQSALGLVTPYATLTRITTPSVYNTSSTTTVLYHPVGDTKMESYTTRKKTRKNNRRIFCVPFRVTVIG